MGTIAARKARQILTNVQYVLAIEFLCSCQAIDIIEGKNKMSNRTKGAYEVLRREISMVDYDRFLSKDIERAKEIIAEERL